MRVAISGCGIAGPTLAYWLHHYGHDVVLVEQAPQLRTGGYMIDCWGTGYDIAEKMGLIPRLRRFGYDIEKTVLVDGGGRRVGGFSNKAIRRLTDGRLVTLRRGDLAAAIFAAVEGKVEVIFGDAMTCVTELADGVRVGFEHGGTQDFDLVVGADGLHSRVRELVFGPESDFEERLGYRVSVAHVDGYRPRNDSAYTTYTAPGRQVSRLALRNDKTMFMFIMRSTGDDAALPSTDDERRRELRNAFRDDAWEVSEILAALDSASDIYFDRASQIRMGSWTSGRAALLGDAAASASLMSGEGSGLAMAEAYVLAGELASVGDGQHQLAFGRYQSRLRKFIRGKQDGAKSLARAFVPTTSLGIRVRDLATRAIAIPFLADVLVQRELNDRVVLPDYPASAS